MNSKRTVIVKDVKIGGRNPIVIQSMTNTDTNDSKATLNQIRRMHESGAHLARVSYPDISCRDSFREIIKKSPIPIVADIHFDYKLALSAIDIGAHKIRINPGNISKANLKEIIKSANERKVPIRIGVNSGSLEKDILKKYKSPVKEALLESMQRSVEFFTDNGFENLVLSIKSSDVIYMIEANKLLKKHFDFPIHLGVTEAGGILRGSIKNTLAIGHLLLLGIGDTIRVSLSEDPIKELETAKMMLSAMHLYENAPDVISCPTCARTTFDVIGVQRIVEERLKKIKKHVKVAIMGCVVNGPGEAREADLGITGTKDRGILFKKGIIIFEGKKEEAVKKLLEEVNNYGK